MLELWTTTTVTWLLAVAQAQQMALIQGIAHPAAGPDLAGQPDLAVGIIDSFTGGEKYDLLPDQPLPPDALIDPDGRHLIGPVKRKLRPETNEEKIEIPSRREAADDTHKTPWKAWFWSMAGCACVVACGVVPAFLLPIEAGAFLQTPGGQRRLRRLLSFAVGTLLGDVFFHLLPETWASYDVDLCTAGLWSLVGLLLCIFIEKCCATTEESQHTICAVVNLIANFVDNFTHGLAVGGSFLVSVRFGVLTTFAILVHEIPHEISDFAILLRGGFNRWSAVKAQVPRSFPFPHLLQLLTATGGVLGATAALCVHCDVASTTAFILPFTAGGFLNIALAQILPELMREDDSRESLLQLLLIVGGSLSMAAVNQLHGVF